MGEYVTVTELPGYKAHGEQIERLFQRYHFAVEYCKNKEVLEVACGGGYWAWIFSKICQKSGGRRY